MVTTTTTTRKAYSKFSGASKRSPPRASALKGSQRVTRSPPSSQSSAARKQGVATLSGVSRSQQRRTVQRVEYKPKPIDIQSQQQIDSELKKLCGDLNDQSKSHINLLDQNVEGLKEVSRQIESTIDEIEQVRQRDIKSVRENTIDKLELLVQRSEGLAQLHQAQSSLTAKQNEFLEKEHQLNNLRHGNSLLSTILNKATELNGDRDQLYSKFNEILSKDLEEQRTEVLKILKETEDEAKEVYKSVDIDRALSEIARAIKTTAVDEIRKREGLQEKYQREQLRAKELKEELERKIKKADEDARRLNKHIDQQNKDVSAKEETLKNIRDSIIKERQGLVQDENRNADLEKKLQEMKNRIRFYEQEKLYLITEKNINNTKVNIQEQLLGERDKAMMDWMKNKIQEDKDKKAALEDKMNQCYSFETKEVIDLFKKEKQLQGGQREEFINSLRDELDQKLDNEKVIKGHVDTATNELKNLRKGTKKASLPFEEDLNIDHEKLYGDLKEVTLDNLDKNQSLATGKKDVKELEVKILLIQDDINNLQNSCKELEDFVDNNQPKVYPVLKIDDSELERLRRELRAKQKELKELEDQRVDLTNKIKESEWEYKNIKTFTSRRFIMKEIGEDGEEIKTSSPPPAKSAFYSPQRQDPEEIRRTRLSQNPTVTREVENVMKEVYYGRPGPKIRKTEDGTFIYGTREFVVWKEKGTLYARDLEGDNNEKEELENYLKIHEIKERETAIRTNLDFLNEDIGSEDEDMAEVGEEFESKDSTRYGFH